jgi:hypothetical protein
MAPRTKVGGEKGEGSVAGSLDVVVVVAVCAVGDIRIACRHHNLAMHAGAVFLKDERMAALAGLGNPAERLVQGGDIVDAVAVYTGRGFHHAALQREHMRVIGCFGIWLSMAGLADGPVLVGILPPGACLEGRMRVFINIGMALHTGYSVLTVDRVVVDLIIHRYVQRFS